ncbi:hypothetical protein SAMN05216251_12233 [Actinacidiphila alni]|uniref:Uncharacterized protein n=1 Tax=Actinacidiphila alni TaxID=380248 RepID=A0A1I2KDX5_9ACTN|nr:hypothetical protein [Actinacidiphila alni]SFF63417.1 hypothetical protein SAMN05216251_12233 [Actinacidiphila alni]
MGDSDRSIRQLKGWTRERLEKLAAARKWHELERIRTVAQFHTYGHGSESGADEPHGLRLRWAEVSLTANDLLPSGTPWDDARKRGQNFALRTWIITHLGPGTDPAWNPEALAADTLAALSLMPALTPDRAGALAANWRLLPAEQIGALRRCKNLTAHVDRLIPLLPPGPAKDRLTSWSEVRKRLP